MNVCIIGEGLTSLSLAKSLVNKKINVHYYHKSKNSNFFSNRTIGISKSNLEFFKEKIFQISKNNYWKINRIEIYTDKIDAENLLKFENDKNDLFYIIKNHELLKSLNSNLIKSKFLISVLSGKIKLGSSGEKVVRETSKRRPITTRAIPAVSMILFMPKLIVLLANFLNSINK